MANKRSSVSEAMQQSRQTRKGIDRQTFYKQYCPSGTRTWILVAAGRCYVTAAVSVYGAVPAALPALFADAGVSLVFGLLIHLRKSLAASWILCLYSVASMLYYLFSAGTLTGVLPVVAAFIAMKQTTHLNALWQRFLKDGKLPK